MRLSLKAGERIFINGAVLRSERRVTIELLNDATFLLEAHVMQLDDATTPLRQLYFIIQSILIDPASRQETRDSVLALLPLLQATYADEAIRDRLGDVRALILDERPFEALRAVRALFPVEQGQPRIAGGASVSGAAPAGAGPIPAKPSQPAPAAVERREDEVAVSRGWRRGVRPTEMETVA